MVKSIDNIDEELAHQTKQAQKFRVLSLVFGIATLLALAIAIVQLYLNHRRDLAVSRRLVEQSQLVQAVEKKILNQTDLMVQLNERILAQAKNIDILKSKTS